VTIPLQVNSKLSNVVASLDLQTRHQDDRDVPPQQLPLHTGLGQTLMCVAGHAVKTDFERPPAEKKN
jgi:hypothetical protein